MSLHTRGLPFVGEGRKTHVHCGTCGAHLGTVKRDGPPPSRFRYRVDSVCLHHERDSTPLRKAYDEARPSCALNRRALARSRALNPPLARFARSFRALIFARVFRR